MSDAKPLTGRKVFVITASAFGVIIAANMAMLFAALDTFPGLEVANSYVASQDFEERATAQESLGWAAEARSEAGQLYLSFRDRNGQVVRPAAITLHIGRTTHSQSESDAVLTWNGTDFVTTLPQGGGKWRLDVNASDSDGTGYQARLSVVDASGG